MVTSPFAEKLADLDISKLEATRSCAEAKKCRRADVRFDPNEVPSIGVPHGCLIVTYRSGGQDRFPNATRADAESVAENVFRSSGGFSGVLRLRCTDCLAIINLTEVESIIFAADDAGEQS